MNKDVSTVGGKFKLEIYKDKETFERGEVEKIIEVKNKMTNASLAVITGLVGNTGSQTSFGYIAVGTSSTAVSASHTALQSEIASNGLTRTAATVSRTTTTQTNDTLVFSKTFTVSGSSSIEEIGIFNNSSSGTMLARALTGTTSVVSGNLLLVTYNWVVVGN